MAKYFGASNYSLSNSVEFTFQVEQAVTTVTLKADPSPQYYPLPVTYSVTVAPSSAALAGQLPTGTVTFFDGGIQVGTGDLANVGGKSVATFSPPGQLALGLHKLTATYSGKGNFAAGNSSDVFHDVIASPTTSTLSAAPSPSSIGQLVTITVEVAATAGTATGLVTFFVDGAPIGTDSLDTVNGKQVAVFDTSAMLLGSRKITAAFDGDVGYADSTANGITHLVNAIGTTISISASPSPSLFTQTVTVTATLTPTSLAPSGNPTGTVTFLDGGIVIGTGKLSTVSGKHVATFDLANPTLGVHSLKAEYTASGDYGGSISGPISHTVNPSGTTITISSGTNPSIYPETITFTAVVAAAAGLASGTVNFFDGGVQIGSESLFLVNGKPTAIFDAVGLDAGIHTIEAKYAGTTGFTSSSSKTLTQTIDPAATTTSMTILPTDGHCRPAGQIDCVR